MKSVNIPTTNNGIELYFDVTLNKMLKKKYKTIRGVLNEIRLKKYTLDKTCSFKLKN